MRRLVLSAATAVALLLTVALIPAAAQPAACDPSTDYLALGDEQMQTDLYAAAESYRCAVAADPTSVDAQIGWFDALTASGRWMEAATPLFVLARHFPDAFSSLISDARSAVMADPDGMNKAAANVLAIANYYGFGEEGDLEALGKALDGTAVYQLLQANALAQQGDADGAAAALDGVADRATPQELNWLAEITAYGLGDIDQGIDLINQAIEAAPDVGALYHTRAYLLLNRDGDVEAALADVNRALELEPLDPNWLVGLWNLTVGSDTDVAGEAVDRMEALVPEGDNLVAALRSATYAVAGDVDGAVRAFVDYVDVHAGESDVVVDGGALSSGETVTGDMFYRRVLVYTFEASAGDSVTITAISPDGVDTQVLVAAPDGTGIALNDDRDPDNQDWNSEITFTAPADGTYTLLVTHSGGQPDGTVEVTVTVTPA